MESYDREVALRESMRTASDVERFDRFLREPTSTNEDLLRVPGVDQPIKDILQGCFSNMFFELSHDELTDKAYDKDNSIMNTSSLLFIFMALRENGANLRDNEQNFYTWLRRTKVVESTAAHQIVYAVSAKVERRGAWKELEDWTFSFTDTSSFS